MHAAFFNEKCSADLTVSLFYGSLVEAFGVLFGKLALEFVQKLLALDEKFVCALSAFLSALITIFGIHLTGMYANPIVAWALTFNCGEVTHFTHFVVYWLAPIMAYILAEEIKF